MEWWLAIASDAIAPCAGDIELDDMAPLLIAPLDIESCDAIASDAMGAALIAPELMWLSDCAKAAAPSDKLAATADKTRVVFIGGPFSAY
jgi:hypothetical protein